MARNFIEEELCTPKEALMLCKKMPVTSSMVRLYDVYNAIADGGGKVNYSFDVLWLITAAYTMGRVQALRESRRKKRI